MKFILTSTSGNKYDIPVTEETSTKIIKDVQGNERTVEYIYDIFEIQTLEELTAMVDKIDQEIIISRCWWDREYLSLEIYDDYRE